MGLQDVIFEIRPDKFAAADEVEVAVLRGQIKCTVAAVDIEAKLRPGQREIITAEERIIVLPDPNPRAPGTSRKMSHHAQVNWY